MTPGRPGEKTVNSAVLQVLVQLFTRWVIEQVTRARTGENMTLVTTLGRLGKKAIKFSMSEGVTMQHTRLVMKISLGQLGKTTLRSSVLEGMVEQPNPMTLGRPMKKNRKLLLSEVKVEKYMEWVGMMRTLVRDHNSSLVLLVVTASTS